MDFIQRMNDVVDYIEENLSVTDGDRLKAESLAGISRTSACHLQRMFAFFADMPLSEYIRRRRLSVAAADLRAGMSVLDASLKYGYSSPTAFNRAFKAVHGTAPSAVRKGRDLLKSYPRLGFSLSVTGREPLEYRIESRGPFRVLGARHSLGKSLDENFRSVPRMWARASFLGTIRRLAELQDNAEFPGILGISLPEKDGSWSYLIATASEKADSRFQSVQIPAFTWAVFPGKGTGRDIQALEKRIVTEWLPSSGYEYDDGPDVEAYLTADPRNAVFEVWIPVVPGTGP